MCRLYNIDGEPSYVRLCAKTGQAGRRVPWREVSEFTDDGFGNGRPGCVFIHAYERFLRSHGLSDDGRVLRLWLPQSESYQDCLREVLRWQNEGTRPSYENRTQILTLERDEQWLDVKEVLARAASFGWKALES